MRSLKISLAVLVCTSASVCLSADWPTWRGPQATGISPESDLRADALEPKANIVWRHNVGLGHSSFAVRDGKLYTMGNIDDQDFIYCLDAASGREVWKFKYDCPEGNYGGPRSTPILDGDRLYALSRDGQIHCIDAGNGSLKWKRNIAESEDISIPRWGLASSGVVAGDKLLFCVGKHGIALDKNSGETLWCGPGEESAYSTPAIYTDGSRKCAAMFSAKSINAVALESGKLLWSHPWETKYDVNAADPIVADGRMFISSGYKRGGGLLNISASQPRRIWENKKMANHFNSSVLIDGHLYGISGNTSRGELVCLAFVTGEEKWRKGKGYEGLMAADGQLIIMDKKGFLTIAAATPAGYRQLASAEVLTDRGAKNWTVPVLANGHVYCRNSKGDIACVDMR